MPKDVLNEEVVVTGEDEEFAQFFNEAIADKPATDPPATDPPATDPPATDPPATDPPATDPPATDPPVEPDEKDKEIAELKKQLEARPSAEAIELAELKKKIAALEAKKEEPVVVKPSEEDIKKLEDDKKFMEEFTSTWGDHARAMRMQQDSIVAQVKDVVEKLLSPIMEKTSTIEKSVFESEEEKILNTVAGVHADWHEHVNSGKLEAWIDTLPNYIKKSAVATLESGSAQEMIELMNDYKEANGLVKVEAKAPEVPSAEVEKPISPRVKSMMTTKNTRTGLQQSIDQNDFDGAFDHFVKEV